MSKKTELQFNLAEPKKHSGKYILNGTENDMYPVAMYFRKEWFENNQLPQKVQVTIEAMSNG